ncbi:MAG TPA: malonic semialdehyde reductase [Gammaproteobacteria bacterium]
MRGIVDKASLQQLFFDARSYNGWTGEAVSDAQLRRLYDIMKMGPTAFNCCPARFVFLRSDDSKERIRPHLRPNNISKTMTAPVVAIIAYDLRFFEHFDELTPYRPENKDHFVDDPERARIVAFRNGSLQGAYFMIAARAVGLDCGPMSGFDNAGVDAEFFPDGRFKSNFICGLGQGDPGSIFERLPRFDFDAVCQLL